MENDSPATVNWNIADGLEVHLNARLVVIPEGNMAECTAGIVPCKSLFIR